MVLLYVIVGALVVFVLTIITAIVRGTRRRGGKPSPESFDNLRRDETEFLTRQN